MDGQGTEAVAGAGAGAGASGGEVGVVTNLWDEKEERQPPRLSDYQLHLALLYIAIALLIFAITLISALACISLSLSLSLSPGCPKSYLVSQVESWTSSRNRCASRIHQGVAATHGLAFLRPQITDL